MDNRLKKIKGFTLVEMMVAVSIFVIVAFIIVSTLLTLSYAYKKAQKMRLLIDNLGFSLQSLSLNIREGTNYKTDQCFDSSIGGVSNNQCIQFIPIDKTDFVCYTYLPSNQSLGKCETGCSSCGEGNAAKLISPGITIGKINFNKTPAGNKRSQVRIIIVGQAGSGRERADFQLQNTVTQRNNDI